MEPGHPPVRPVLLRLHGVSLSDGVSGPRKRRRQRSEALRSRHHLAGATWSHAPLPDSPSGGVSCPSPSTCFSLGGGTPNVAMTTTNGGTSWTTKPVDATFLDAYGLACPSVSTCFSVGIGSNTGVGSGSGQGSNGPVIERTTNAWDSSSAVDTTPEVQNISAISCPDTQHFLVFAAADGDTYSEVLSTSDGESHLADLNVDSRGGYTCRFFGASPHSSASNCVDVSFFSDDATRHRRRRADVGRRAAAVCKPRCCGLQHT